MREFHSFLEAATHCAELALAQHEADHRALERATKLLQRKVKIKFGTYQPQAGQFLEWAELADSTKADREAQGFPENEPLLRTGDLRESVERLVKDSEGYVGSNSDIAVYQEIGTKHIPPRSFLGSTGVENAEAVANICGEEAVMALVSQHVFQGALDIKEWSSPVTQAAGVP